MGNLKGQGVDFSHNFISSRTTRLIVDHHTNNHWSHWKSSFCTKIVLYNSTVYLTVHRNVWGAHTTDTFLQLITHTWRTPGMDVFWRETRPSTRNSFDIRGTNPIFRMVVIRRHLRWYPDTPIFLDGGTRSNYLILPPRWGCNSLSNNTWSLSHGVQLTASFVWCSIIKWEPVWCRVFDVR